LLMTLNTNLFYLISEELLTGFLYRILGVYFS